MKEEINIYVVEDEKDISDIIVLYLKKEGYRVKAFYNGEKALNEILEIPPHLVILDIMLPDMDGLSILRELRKKSFLPVIFLTSRKDEVDKIIGLEIGADDYISKPFSPREMVARVKSVLRRVKTYKSSQARKTSNNVIESGKFSLDLDGMRIVTKKNSIKLTSTEFELLRLLMKRPGRIFSRTDLLDLVWGEEFEGESRTVDVHIRNLRKKIKKACGSINSIQSIRGVGYAFEN